MPPPTSPPTPSLPTQVLQLQLPPYVLDRLSPPDTGWFTQPVATVLTGFGALLAAVVAYIAATRTIRAADRRAATDRKAAADAAALQIRSADLRASGDRQASAEALRTQLDAQTESQRRAHETEREHRDRAEQVQALVAASKAMTMLFHFSTLYGSTLANPTRPPAAHTARVDLVADRYIDEQAECDACVERLRLLGLSSWHSLQTFTLMCNSTRDGTTSFDDLLVSLNRARAAQIEDLA